MGAHRRGFPQRERASPGFLHGIASPFPCLAPTAAHTASLPALRDMGRSALLDSTSQKPLSISKRTSQNSRKPERLSRNRAEPNHAHPETLNIPRILQDAAPYCGTPTSTNKYAIKVADRLRSPSLSVFNRAQTRCIAKGEAQKSPLFRRFSRGGGGGG